MAKCIDEFKVISGNREARCTIYGLQRNDKVIFYAVYTIQMTALKHHLAEEEGPFELFQPRDGIVLSQFREYAEEYIGELLQSKMKELA